MKEIIEPLRESKKSEKLEKSDRFSIQSIKPQKSVVIGVSIMIFIIFITIVMLTLFLYNKSSSKKEEKGNNLFPEKMETSPLMYGTKISNISYSNNKIIINSFKVNGDNYKEEIGNINNGSDYNETDRNKYTLFIPYSATKNKDKYNAIILFIHGELWTKGNKEYIEPLAEIYSQYGYITSVMDYTLLSDKYKENNIFRILDEITSCIKNLKEKLESEGFDGNKLEIAIGGYSAGAHLALLYSYSINNLPLKIKFIINISGPVTLEPKYWKKISKENETLENIEPDDIEKAIYENKILPAVDDVYFSLNLMNIFIGKKYSKDELNNMIENKAINENNEKYQELLNIVKYAFPVQYSINNTIPTLCIYGGNDTLIGINHFAYLKLSYNKTENNLFMIYSRYADHYVINYSIESNINAMREMHYQILNFSKLYFNSYL